MNSVCMAGNCGKDPTIKTVQGNNGDIKIAETTMAVYRSGEPLWLNIKAYGKTAETLAQYVKKGHKFGITGSLDKEAWTDQQSGQQKERWLIKAEKVHLLQPSTNSGADNKPQAQNRPASSSQSSDGMPF